MASLALGAHGEGLVVAVDVQQAAIDSTRQHLERNVDETCLRSVRYHCLCHSNLDALLPNASAALVAFNLGYLPGGAKELTTTATSTLAAVEASCRLLKPGGLISLVVYVGHPGAREEVEAVEGLCAHLSSTDWNVGHWEWANRPLSPHLFLIYRKA